MADPQLQSLTEEEARTVWARALEMQSESALRSEEQSAKLALQGTHLATQDGDFRLDHVTAAAVEAGISEEFMRLALVELEVTREERRKVSGRKGRAIDRWLRNDQTALEAGRTIRASPDVVLTAMRQILPNAPYGLTLIDSAGDDPVTDGVLVFRVPGYVSVQSAFNMAMLYGTVRHILVTVRGTGEEGGHTRVTLRAPLYAHRNESYWLGLASGMALAATAGGGGFAIAAAGAATLAAPLAGLAAGVALGSLGAVGLVRWSFPYGIRKAKAGLDDLLKVLDAHVRTGGQFVATKPLSQPSGKDNDAEFLLGG